MLGGESVSGARAGSATWGAGAGAGSVLVGDASRIAPSFDALATAAALLPLRGFLARSLVGYTQKTKAKTVASVLVARAERRKQGRSRKQSGRGLLEKHHRQTTCYQNEPT